MYAEKKSITQIIIYLSSMLNALIAIPIVFLKFVGIV